MANNARRVELASERAERTIREDERKRERVRNFRDELVHGIEAEAIHERERHNKELEMIRKTNGEALKDVAKLTATVKESSDGLEAEIKREAEDREELIRKEYGAVTEKHVSKYELKGKEIEAELMAGDKKYKEVRDNSEKVLTGMKEDANAELEKMAQRHRDANFKRGLDELETLANNTEDGLQGDREVAQKEVENLKQNAELHNKLMGQSMEMMFHHFKTLVLLGSQKDVDHLNDSLERMRELLERIEKNYATCRQHFVDKVNTEKAKKHFEELQQAFMNLRKHLIKLRRELADVDEVESKDQKEAFNKISLNCSNQSDCVANFIGRFQVGNTERNKNDEEQLGKLMKELREIMFCEFASKNNALKMHLSSSAQKARDAYETGSIKTTEKKEKPN